MVYMHVVKTWSWISCIRRIEMKVYDPRNFFSATKKQQRERGLKSSERDSNSEVCDAGAVSHQSAIVMLVDN